jgi:hypothetical protein
MWCPKCGAEYREGFFECSDCKIPLTEDIYKLPIRLQPKYESKMGAKMSNEETKNQIIGTIVLVVILIFIFRGCIFSSPSTNKTAVSNKPKLTESDFNDPAEYMSKLSRHSKDEFQGQINIIQSYYPSVEKRWIGFYVFMMYSETKKTLPSLDIYDYVKGFKDFVRDLPVSAGSDKDALGKALTLYSAGLLAGYGD